MNGLYLTNKLCFSWIPRSIIMIGCVYLQAVMLLATLVAGSVGCEHVCVCRYIMIYIYIYTLRKYIILLILFCFVLSKGANGADKELTCKLHAIYGLLFLFSLNVVSLSLHILNFCLYLCISIFLSIYLPIHPFICLSIYLYIYIYIYIYRYILFYLIFLKR